MYRDTNVYYSPSDAGLEPFIELNEPDMSYEYNTLIVLKHTESGRLFYASDSGCSCPVPFEDYYFNSPDEHNMTEVTKENMDQILGFIDNFPVDLEDTIKATNKLREAVRNGS